MRRALTLSLGLLAAGGAYALLRAARRRAPLAGAVALIAGGSRGLGFLLARELGHRGMRVALCARDEEELERARAILAADGVDATALPGDVTDEEGLRTLVADVEERLGPIELLVNSAGVMQVGPAEAMALEDYHLAMDVLFWGSLHAAEAVLPGMRARRRGTVVNVTSLGACVGFPHLAPHAAAKFAVRGWSEALGAEAARDGVNVITVVPGLMRTGSFGRALVKGRRQVEAGLLAVLGSLPVLTVNAERAARRVARAVERRERFVVIGLPARALRLAHALFPGLVVRGLGQANRLLPRAPPEARDGMALPAELYRRGLARSILTALGERAARRYNEEPG